MIQFIKNLLFIRKINKMIRKEKYIYDGFPDNFFELIDKLPESINRTIVVNDDRNRFYLFIHLYDVGDNCYWIEGHDRVANLKVRESYVWGKENVIEGINKVFGRYLKTIDPPL